MKIKVTDPCYVIDNKVWDDLCELASNAQALGGDWVEAFEGFVESYLKEKTGAEWAKAGGTGYGDWGNRMSGSAVVKPDFFADAGMWCVIPYDFNECGSVDDTNGVAVLEFDDRSDISVRVEDLNDNQWTEISVHGVKNGNYVTCYSLGYNEDEEE